jgi:hypothetical protein
MALFLLENRDFLGFRMIFKVPLNQIFSSFSTMLWTKIWNVGVSVIDILMIRILQIINPVDKMWHCDWPRDRCSDYHKVPSVVKNV